MTFHCLNYCHYEILTIGSVITVHGIRDDYNTAWTTKQGEWWVRHQLFKDKRAREIDYSYDVCEGSDIFDPEGIHLHARWLIDQYARIRAKLEEVCLFILLLGLGQGLLPRTRRPGILTWTDQN